MTWGEERYPCRAVKWNIEMKEETERGNIGPQAVRARLLPNNCDLCYFEQPLQAFESFAPKISE